MRIAVIGAGSAGLYFAALWKSRHRSDELVVLEQNQAGATYGFGVVFSDRALDFLQQDDPATHELITPRMQHWHDITLDLRGTRIIIDGIGFSAIGRLELLRLLRKRAEDEGVMLHYGRKVGSAAELTDFDLVVGADGANSVIRQSLAGEFGVHAETLDNRFGWFGASMAFDTLTQTFVDSAWGPFNAHHYGYAHGMSTFIVECGPQTWRRAGFDTMDEEDARLLCGRIFADALGGVPLMANRSVWRRFPLITCARWSHGKTVLIGDASHTAHFSIGSGTRLALEDALALVKALGAQPRSVAAGLARYEAERRPALDKLVAAARRSAQWYESFGAHMALPPAEFAMSYLTRSGRIDENRLAAQSPRFAAWYADNRCAD